jgi:hypothetical protein
VTKSLPKLPTGPLRDLVAWWRSAKVQGVFIGGLAVAMVGKARITQDVDALLFIDDKRLSGFLKKGKTYSFQSRIPDPVAYAKENRILLVHHTKSGIDVDLSIAGHPYETQLLERSREAKIGRLLLPVPSPEDLIILKAIANRDQDKKDIEGIMDRWPDLDHDFIQKIVDEFAAIIDSSEISADIRRSISRRKSQQGDS